MTNILDRYGRDSVAEQKICSWKLWEDSEWSNEGLPLDNSMAQSYLHFSR